MGPSSTATANAGKGADKGAGKGAGKAVDQVAPDGPCSVEEVTVTPVATKAPAGKAIPIQLQLTGIRPACTFAVSSAVLAVKVSRGSTRTWSSQDCPSAVKRQSVVVRSSSPVTVQVAWDGRRSTSGQCGRTNSWVLPGKYQVTAAAIGSEPSQGQITLVQPERPVVIKTIKPKPKKQKSVGVSPVTGKKTD